MQINKVYWLTHDLFFFTHIAFHQILKIGKPTLNLENQNIFSVFHSIPLRWEALLCDFNSINWTCHEWLAITKYTLQGWGGGNGRTRTKDQGPRTRTSTGRESRPTGVWNWQCSCKREDSLDGGQLAPLATEKIHIVCSKSENKLTKTLPNQKQ